LLGDHIEMGKGRYDRKNASRGSSVIACTTEKGADSSDSMKNKTALTVGCVLAAIFAFVAAAGGHPYSFYTTTRWVIFLVCCWGWYQNLESSPKGINFAFIVIGVLFNPFIPFRFKRDIWQVIDVITAITIIATTFVMNNKNANSKN